MANTFRHRKISDQMRISIASILATKLLGPKPDMSHLKPRAESIVKQLDAMIIQDPARQAWFDLPSDFRSKVKESSYRYNSLWNNNTPDLLRILDGMGSDEQIHGIGCRQINSVCNSMDVYLADIDYYYISSDDILNDFANRYGEVSHFTDFTAMEKHRPKTIDYNTLVKDHNGYELTLYDALAKIAVEYAGYDVNHKNLRRKLKAEMEDCTTKQVIEAWPQAEQLIHDAYGFQPNVSKPTAPLSQVIADAGILQITAQ